ncbi:MAG: hypothetical protein EBR52_08655, partial [Microbacteriaceae bacterium]|nr:hypothetical protein [Microbacteriaceae bacterium]
MYDHFRVLAARLGRMHCPDCSTPVGTQSIDQTVERLLEHGPEARLLLLAPIELRVGQTPEALFAALQAAGHVRVRIDGKTVRLDEKPTLDRKRKSRIEIVIDRVTAEA